MALTETLVSVLGVTIVKMFSGEQRALKVWTKELDGAAKIVLDYSESRLEKMKKRCFIYPLYLFTAGICRSHTEWIRKRKCTRMLVHFRPFVCTEGGVGKRKLI